MIFWLITILKSNVQDVKAERLLKEGQQNIILENLNVISRGLPNKTPMPILTGIKLHLTETDLFMTSSNTDISVQVNISDASLQIVKPGKAVVPGKFFIEIIRNNRGYALFL